MGSFLCNMLGFVKEAVRHYYCPSNYVTTRADTETEAHLPQHFDAVLHVVRDAQCGFDEVDQLSPATQIAK